MLTGKEFIAGFQRLLLSQPRYNVKHVQAENCDFADTAVKSKNCYYSFCSFYSEDLLYSRYSRECTDCNGMTLCFKCERCVECSDCVSGYNLAFCRDCRDCTDCSLCEDCISCQDCFGCVGQYRKQFCLFNETLPEQEYRAWLAAIDLREPVQLARVRQHVQDLKARVPLLGLHHFRTEDCTGDHLSECSNAYQCYDAFKLEDCLYVVEANALKDCCDMTVCFEDERCYSCVQCPLCYNCNFLLHSDQCIDSEFCAYSKKLTNCFGCVYQADKQFCILNKRVPEQEYHAQVAEIRRDLISLRCYNLGLYLVSDYEQRRLANEPDPVINDIIG